MDKIHEYAIKLIRYVLTGEKPEQLPEIDYRELLDFGERHGIENILYVALNDLEIEVPAKVMEDFQELYEMQIVAEANQTFEYEELSEELEKHGIDYFPFKGIVLRDLYPMPDYRKSCDIDIMIRPEDEYKMDDIMTGLGYERDGHFDTYEVHCGYKKQPFIEVEVHRQLLKPTNRAYGFFKSIWDHLLPPDDGTHKYTMSNELMYTYLLAHLSNHIYMGGAGIRMMMDFYVLPNKTELNEDLLTEYIKKANLTELNNMVRQLMEKWFGTGYREEKNVELLEKIVFDGGSFGTEEMHKILMQSNTGAGKLRQLMQRIFLNTDKLLLQHPEYGEGTNSKLIIQLRRIKHILFKRKRVVIDTVRTRMSSERSDMDFRDIAMAVCDR